MCLSSIKIAQNMVKVVRMSHYVPRTSAATLEIAQLNFMLMQDTLMTSHLQMPMKSQHLQESLRLVSTVASGNTA